MQRIFHKNIFIKHNIYVLIVQYPMQCSGPLINMNISFLVPFCTGEWGSN